jgi:hypothetical protein
MENDSPFAIRPEAPCPHALSAIRPREGDPASNFTNFFQSPMNNELRRIESQPGTASIFWIAP